MENDLPAAHPRRPAAGEGKIDRFVESLGWERLDIGCVPVVHLADPVLQRAQARGRFGLRSAIGVRLAFQMVLEDAVNHVDMIEKTKKNIHVLLAEGVTALLDRRKQVPVGPAFYIDKLLIGQADHLTLLIHSLPLWDCQNMSNCSQ